MKKPLCIFIFIACLHLYIAASQAGNERRVLHYWPEKVTLTGRLVYRTFYGPPNYGENPKTDSKETQSILLLDSAIDIIAVKQDALSATERGVKRVTLVFGESTPHPVRFYLKRRVTVEGTLIHAHTGHHHTKILIDVSSIKRAT